MAATNTQNTWLSKFTKNAAAVLPVPPSLMAAPTTPSAAGSAFPKTPLSPTLKDPFRHALSVPYTLSFEKIENLPIPAAITDVYLRAANSPLSIQLRASLFDVDSASFFGKTWISKEAINLRSGKKSTHDGSNNVFAHTDAEDHQDSEEDSEAEEDIAAGATNVVGRRITVNLNENLRKEAEVYMHTSVNSPSVMVVVEFIFIADQTATGSKPSEIDQSKELLISGGWTFFYPYDTERGGMNVRNAIEKYDQGLDGGNTDSRLIELYNGTPRALLMIAPLMKGVMVGYPALNAMTGTVLSYKFAPNFDLRPITHLWKENVFISRLDRIPGMECSSRHNELVPKPSLKVTLSELRISLFPTVTKYESFLLSKIAESYYNSNPKAVPEGVKDVSELPLPTILERRIHIGVHNGHTFLNNPVITTLRVPTDSDDEDDLNHTYLVFNGNIELDKYLRPDNGEPNSDVALVFFVEYKVLIGAKEIVEEKTGLSAVIEKLNSAGVKEPEEKLGVEKSVTIGWGFWNQPGVFNDEQEPCALKLITTNGPNPYSAPVFSLTEEDIGQLAITSTDAQIANNLAKSDDTVHLSFNFTEGGYTTLSRPASPVRTKPPSLKSPIKKKKPSLPPTREPLEPSKPIVVMDNKEEMETEMPETEMLPLPSTRPIDGSYPVPSSTRKPFHRSRSEKARLLHAGFTQILDEKGRRLTAINDDDNIKYALTNELKDSNKVNDVTLRMCGLTFFGANMDVPLPQSVYFTFQFYTFHHMTTERLHVYTGHLPPLSRGGQPVNSKPYHRSASVPAKSHARHMSQDSLHSQVGENEDGVAVMGNDGNGYWPGILWKYDQDGSVAFTSPPGLTINYLMDILSEYPTNKPVPPFLQYLSQHHLYIDIWDGDSLLPVGTASIPLVKLLRQGKNGVIWDSDVDIYLNQVSEEVTTSKTNSQLALNNNFSAMDRSAVLSNQIIGKLHFTLANVGHKSHLSDALLDSKPTLVIPDYHDGLKSKVGVEKHVLRKLADVDAELASLLATAQQERAESKHRREVSPEKNDKMSHEEKKLSRFRRIRDKENLAPKSIADAAESYDMETYQQTREERDRDLQTVGVFRERKKRNTIMTALQSQITTSYNVRAVFGEAHFFEYVFTNPYGSDHTFVIDFNDNELRVVTNAQEWKYLRRVHQIHAGVEEKLINARPSDGSYEIFVYANETVSIPFVYQSFLSGTLEEAKSVDHAVSYSQTSGLSPRTLQIGFLNKNKAPVALLDLHIDPRPYSVQRVFRFFKSENEILRKVIRFAFSNTAGLTPIGKDGVSEMFDTANPLRKYLRCNVDGAICSLTELNKGGATTSNGGASGMKELSFKYRSGPAPETEVIYFNFYNDPYHTSLYETWRVVVHALQRVDINCVWGQTNNAALVLKGASFSQNVQCFSSHPNELLISPPEPFSLTANSLNEVALIIKPRLQQTTKDIILNIVDTDAKCLFSSWLVVTHVSAPTITKAFELSLPLNRVVNKRVTYTNAYLHKKVYNLKTNRDNLLRFKEAVLELESGATQYLHLQFQPVSTPQVMEVLVFINDENDQTEECLSIKVSFVDTQ